MRTSAVRAAGGFEVWARVKDTGRHSQKPGTGFKGIKGQENSH